jgi:guanylate kinase
MSSGKLVVISSPSGGGKTTVIQKLLREKPDLNYSVSATTRPPRAGEVNGRDYWFLTKEEFFRRIRADEFFEWAVVHGEYYGTLKSQTDTGLKEGQNLILDIDIQGGLSVRAKEKHAILIFLMPPSLSELEKRLMARGTDEPLSIERRMRQAESEMEAAGVYDYIVFNHDVNQAVKDIHSIINNH